MSATRIGFSRMDCELFERYPERVPFTDENVPVADKQAFRGLRERLRALAEQTAANSETGVALRPAASSLNPNGRAPGDLWACVYPRAVPNKSYGLQVAVIVSARGIELCLCLGAGRSQLRDSAERAAAEAELARLKDVVGTMPTRVREELRATLTRAFGARGWLLRRRWREPVGTRDFTTLEAWLDHASGTDGNGASISVDIPPEDVDARSPSIGPLLERLTTAAGPLLEHAYLAPAARRKEPGSGAAQTRSRGASASSSLADVAKTLYLETGFLRGIVRSLNDRGQVILYGPPGTGKTYVARRLVEHLAPQESCRDIVQFHPSYSYEDFVMGFRPASREGELVYELCEGPLLRLARRAAADRRRRHVLLVDEINRGNLPRIFGELLHVLDYRDEWISLMYRPSSERCDGALFDASGRFRLPSNLFIIATMNTADRSIGLIDAALRRRFRFIPFFPDEGALRGLLARWLSDTQAASVQPLAGWVERLNALLRDELGRHLQVGHSYFMRKRLTVTDVERIWAADIIPFLEDQLFGHPADDLEKYGLASIRRDGRRGVADADAAAR